MYKVEPVSDVRGTLGATLLTNN